MNLSVISKKIRQFPILFVCGILIPLALVLLFMRGPKVIEYEADLADLEREWQSIQKNVERSVGLEDDIVSLNEGLKTLDGRLMNVDEVASNYEFFYGLERQSEITVRQFSQGDASDGRNLPIGMDKMQHFSCIPYDVVISGTLAQILGFLDTLDRQNFIVRVDLLTLSKPGDAGPESEALNARLKCHVLASKHE